MSISVSTLLAYVETKTQAGTGTLNNTGTGIPMLNEALLDFRSELIKRNIDGSQTQESYLPTVTKPASGQGSTFAYPTDMYFLKTIEINMTTGSTNDYVQAQIMDVSNTPSQVSFDWLRLNQDMNQPMVDDRGDTFEVFPSFTNATNLTNAIKIIYYLTPTPYVNTSDTLTYPDTLDWYVLANKVAVIYYESLNKFTEADVWEQKYQKRLAKLIVTEAEGSQQPLNVQQLPTTGWEF